MMKRCPTCNKTYTDRNLSFCIDDGTPLVPVVDDESTVVSPKSQSGSTARGPQPYENPWQAPDYQPPGSHVPPGANQGRRTWPWVIGVLAVLLIGVIGLGVAAAIMIPRMLRASNNRKRPPANVTVTVPEEHNSNSNLNTNSRENANESTDETTPAPTDRAAVLSQLTDVEHQWTVANINADKKALDRILADDYVGITEGKRQGKAQYIREIRRDTSIQKWEFSDFKLDLKGDRAILTGTVKFILKDQEPRFHFTDKFVWRDGRWQATGSQVDLIKDNESKGTTL